MSTPEDPTPPRDLLFERDVLALTIAFEQAKRGRRVTFDNASIIATSLMRKDEELPLHLLDAVHNH